MPIELTWLTILQHLGNALIPLLVVLVVGGGCAWLFAWIFQRLYKRHPRGRQLMLLLPWRSMAMLLGFMILNSALWDWNFNIPSNYVLNNTGLTLLVLFIPWVVQAILNARFPLPFKIQVLAVIRTLSILSLILPVFLQTEGLGHFIFMAAYWFEMTKVRTGYLVLGVIMLIVDLIIGIVQLLIARKQTMLTA